MVNSADLVSSLIYEFWNMEWDASLASSTFGIDN